MEITLKLFATLGQYLPHELDGRKPSYNQLPVDVAESSTVEAVIDRFRVPRAKAHLVLVNGVFIPPHARAMHRLNPGDELAVWPPIAGG